MIPQLGAFLMKQSTREVIFSEFLKQDDGELRARMVKQGMGTIEAASTINRFVFEVRHVLSRGGDYPLDGLGSLSLEQSTRKIVFTAGPIVDLLRHPSKINNLTILAEKRLERDADEMSNGGSQERLNAVAQAAHGALEGPIDHQMITPLINKKEDPAAPAAPFMEEAPESVTRHAWGEEERAPQLEEAISASEQQEREAERAVLEMRERIAAHKREAEMQEEMALEEQKEETQKREAHLLEVQQREEQLQEEQLRHEQKLRETQLRHEEELREIQQREEHLREVQEREAQLLEDQLREAQILEEQLREAQEREVRLLEEQYRNEEELREARIREEKVRQEARDREEQLREEQLREKKLLEEKLLETESRERELLEAQLLDRRILEAQLLSALDSDHCEEQPTKSEEDKDSEVEVTKVNEQEELQSEPQEESLEEPSSEEELNGESCEEQTAEEEDTYIYIDQSEEAESAEEEEESEEEELPDVVFEELGTEADSKPNNEKLAGRKGGATEEKRSQRSNSNRVDFFVILAYVVFAIAVGTIVYSFYVKALGEVWGIM